LIVCPAEVELEKSEVALGWDSAKFPGELIDAQQESSQGSWSPVEKILRRKKMTPGGRPRGSVGCHGQ